jgi:hypothetical protein
MLPRVEDLPNSAQGLSEYRLNCGQRQVPPSRPRHDDQVARDGQGVAVEAVSLAKQPLDAVPANRVPMPFADAQSQARVAESIRQGADAHLAKLKDAPFLKNTVEIPFQPHMLECSKPAVHVHLNVLHCSAELLGRFGHYSISFIARQGQATSEGQSLRKAASFVWRHCGRMVRAAIFHAGWPANVPFCYGCRSREHRELPGLN